MKKIISILYLALILSAGEFKTLEFQGNSLIEFSDDTLLKVLGVEYPKIYQFWKNEPTFDQTDKKEFIRLLRKFYKSKGFYKVEVNSTTNKDKLTLNITENEAIQINNIKIKSDYSLSDYSLKNGEEFSTIKFKDSKSEIQSLLLNDGYAKHSLDVKAYANLKDYKVDIEINLLKGEISKFGDVNISGVDVNKHFFEDKIMFKKGETFNLKKLQNSSRNLYKSDVFENIALNFNLDINSTEIPIHIHLREKLRRVLKASIGFDTDKGLRGGVSWLHRNFFGNLETLKFDLYASQKDYGIESRFLKRDLKIAKYRMKLENLLTIKDEKFSGYSKQEITETLLFGKKILWLEHFFGLKFEASKIDTNFNLYDLKDESYLINSFIYRVELDKRDSKLNAKNGYFLKFMLENATSLLASELDYLKILFEARYIKTTKHFIFANRLQIGNISKDIPRFKRFFSGGTFSNRGYKYDEVGAKDLENNPIGGNSFIEYMFELRREVYKELELAFFFDTTLLERKKYSFNSTFYNTVGFGLRYNTVIGPLRLDFGFPQKEQDDINFHFSIGQAF